MKICAFCEKSLVGMKDASRRKYCSRDCMVSDRLQSPLTNKSTAHYRARAAVTKDKCERCPRTTKLHVHHKDRNPLNDDATNLEVLCSTCHAREHQPLKMSVCAVCGQIFRAASHRNRNKICSALCASEWSRIHAKLRWQRERENSAPMETASILRKRQASSAPTWKGTWAEKMPCPTACLSGAREISTSTERKHHETIS